MRSWLFDCHTEYETLPFEWYCLCIHIAVDELISQHFYPTLAYYFHHHITVVPALGNPTGNLQPTYMHGTHVWQYCFA